MAEIQAVASFLRRRSEDPNVWSPNQILLGDFNIFSKGPSNDAFAAFADNGFEIPEALHDVPHSNVGSAGRFYDQIALKVRDNNLVPTGQAGVFDYFDVVYRDDDFEDHTTAMMDGLSENDPDNPLTFDSRGRVRTLVQQGRYYRHHWRRRQMSDHLPMWVELKIDHGEAYLANRSNAAAPA